jgi:hypothetical protein
VLPRLLRDEARALRAYWDSGDKESADRFHQARAKAGARVGELVRFAP